MLLPGGLERTLTVGLGIALSPLPMAWAFVSYDFLSVQPAANALVASSLLALLLFASPVKSFGLRWRASCCRFFLCDWRRCGVQGAGPRAERGDGRRGHVREATEGGVVR